MLEQLVRNFALYFPMTAEKMVEYKTTNCFDLTAKLSDGNFVLYDDASHSIRNLPRDSRNMSEEEFKKELSYRLRSIMSRRGITQWKLSKMTGISNVLLSKYMHGKNIPSAYKLDKIAKALDCSMDDLTYI